MIYKKKNYTKIINILFITLIESIVQQKINQFIFINNNLKNSIFLIFKLKLLLYI